jgi:hypothetical protein
VQQEVLASRQRQIEADRVAATEQQQTEDGEAEDGAGALVTQEAPAAHRGAQSDEHAEHGPAPMVEQLTGEEPLHDLAAAVRVRPEGVDVVLRARRPLAVHEQRDDDPRRTERTADTDRRGASEAAQHLWGRTSTQIPSARSAKYPVRKWHAIVSPRNRAATA